MTAQKAKFEPILGSFKELQNAREFALDVVCGNMSLDEAREIVSSYSNLDLCRFVEKNWNNGIQGWAARGELEYR